MVALAALEAEPWWTAEVEAPAHAAFNARMRTAFGLGPAAIGSKGDSAHLYGRHRSRDWDLNSRYCTDRSYGTTDSRDRAGAGRWLRASDLGIFGPKHWAAAHRLDAAVRAGRLPAVAEWFGTYDGKTVTGWYEGHPSSADDSHLTHLHVGLWTSRCDDAAQLQLLGDIILGTGSQEAPAMRFVFGTAIGGDGRHVYVTDGVRYRVQPLASDVDGWLTAAGAGPIVAVNERPAPGWTLDQIVGALCGKPDPGEFAGGEEDGTGLTQADVDARIAASTVTIAPPKA